MQPSTLSFYDDLGISFNSNYNTYIYDSFVLNNIREMFEHTWFKIIFMHLDQKN